MRSNLARDFRHADACALLATLAVACASDDTSTSTVVVRDSAGVAIVQSTAPQWSPGTEWRIGDVRVTFEAPDLIGVFGAVRLSNGTVVAAEEGGSRLLFFGPDGTMRRSVGRSGEGPGEFRLPQGLGRAADDAVWVYDYSRARVTRFSATGDLVDIVLLTPPLPSALAIGSLADGSLILMGQWRTTGARAAEGLVRDTVAVVRYLDGRLVDTVGTTPGREFVQFAEPGGRMVMSTAIMPRRASVAIWRGSIVLGDQVDHTLRVVGSDGVVRRLIRWIGPDLTVSAAELSTWMDARVQVAHPDQRNATRALLESAPTPDRRPSYDRLLADASGHLWVGEYSTTEDEPSRWDILDPNGVWLGAVRAPQRFRPLEIGSDWVLGVARDSLDVERIELRTLVR